MKFSYINAVRYKDSDSSLEKLWRVFFVASILLAKNKRVQVVLKKPAYNFLIMLK